jgi:glutathione S-transferase
VVAVPSAQQEESIVKLYGFSASPNTWKVRAVAVHLGIPLDYEFVDLTKGESRTPRFLAINPTGRTPALVDGDFKLWESTAIVQYLASQKPNSLWPDDARVQADIARWQSWELAHWGKEACQPLLFERLVKRVLNIGAPDEAVVAKATECFHKEAKVLDDHLAKQPYLAGKDVTIADFSVAAPLFYAQGAALPLEPYPRVREWFGRVAALPCWQQTAPPMPAAA